MILNAIKKRRAVRVYKSDAVSDEAINEILRAGKFAPTSYGNASVEFVVIRDQQTKDAVFNVIDQDYIKTAPVLIAPVISSKSKLPSEDLALASGNIFAQASELGLATVWKHLTPGWADKVKEILGVPAEFKMVNIIPLGYAAEEKEDHQDSELKENEIHIEKW